MTAMKDRATYSWPIVGITPTTGASTAPAAPASPAP